MNSNLKAFVIMPFDPEFSSIYEQLIKPALEEVGYEVSRADSFLDQQNILKRIVRGIEEADLVIADLTALNPNVFYELGIVHALNVPTILLAQSMDEVPFDLRGYKIQIYSTHFDQAFKLKQILKEIGRKHQGKEIAFGSPVTDFLSKDRQRRSGLISQLEGEEDRGFLDFIVEGVQAGQEIARIMGEFTKETASIGKKVEGHTQQIGILTGNPVPGTATLVHKVTLEAARDINNCSEEIEKRQDQFDGNVEILVGSLSGYFNSIVPDSPEQRQQLLNQRQAASQLLESSRGGIVATRAFRNTVAGMAKISRDLTRANRRLTGALDNVLISMEKIEAFCARSLPLIDEKLSGRES
ncbi:MAG: hypothetical protein ACREIJ_00990 [Nitrospiraceae bacterium]